MPLYRWVEVDGTNIFTEDFTSGGVSIDDVKADADIADSLTKKHANSLDHDNVLITHTHDYADVNHTHPGGGADIKSGIVTLSAGGTTSVTFNTVFSSTPQVIVTAQFNNADSSCTYSTYNITANGFSLRGAGNPAGTVGWMATNGGNP